MMQAQEHKWIDRVEQMLYIAIGGVLAIAAIVLLIWSVVHFVGMIIGGEVGAAVLQALDSLLLIVMLIEILHTVRISLRSRVLLIEPFLVVGIIAAVRRLLVITAEQATPTAEEQIEFQLAMLELGILILMILTLVGAIFLIRKFPRAGGENTYSEEQRTATPGNTE
jgi:uncharacterized membrane protein (DUF373 family)